ncbi:MAG TPA: family 43 glycosylhydrolase, partial [Acidimicrobiales bacterium]|nr:family 43 glycosylhydrolase [Acidimicrobiales bacterium]
PPPVGIAKAMANPTLRAFSWDLAEVWYATSPDGHNWTERGVAVHRGPEGGYDARTVCTANILVAKGRYYLFYQAAAGLGPADTGDFARNVIGMSWAKSPDGPWTRAEEPVLKTGPAGAFDHLHVHDPGLIVRNGKYWLYYKASPGGSLALGRDELPLGPILTRQAHLVGAEGGASGRDARWGIPISWGVAMADKPEGPYVKSGLNPVICGGHETEVWPYRRGVCALLWQGPEKFSLQYAEDGLNFVPKAHGLDVPRSAGFYRADKFIDTDSQPGPGITWGLHHAVHNKWLYLVRFDCDLTLERGEKIRKTNDELQKWLKEQQWNS